MKDFVHLHVHTEYSLLDGVARIDRLFKACNDKGMSAVAITDHGNMYGTMAFAKAASKNKSVKAIFGSEFYLCDDLSQRDADSARSVSHLTMLAKDQEGYKNLVKLSTISFVDGFYYRPRIDLNVLRQHTKGLICLSGCLSGKVSQLLLENRYEDAKAYAVMMSKMFEQGDFYLEIQDHGQPEQAQINPMLVKMSNETGLKLVATNDVHYINKKDAALQDILLCISTQKKLEDANRLKFSSDELYLKSYDEMYQRFKHIPQALENTLEIAQKCNARPPEKQPLYPAYIPPDNMSAKDYLYKLTMEGVNKYYNKDGHIDDEVIKRVSYELSIIDKTGFNEYFLIVWDFIHYAEKSGIPVGPGRGSGVGSVVAYALGITKVEPLRFGLYFERFLNPERVSPPDFDNDFCYERRGEVIDYVSNLYGKDKVSQIVTFGTLAAKAAIKDVGRVMNVPYADVDKVTKLIPFKGTLGKVFGKVPLTDDEASFNIPELKDIYENDPTMARVIDVAIELEGIPRNTSTHAAGVVICRDSISDHVPLQRNGADITTQFDKGEIEEAGLLKMDILGLRTLTDISKAQQYIKQNKGIDIDFYKMEYNDAEVFKLIGDGDTDAVFQLESQGMRNFMKKLKPEVLEDIIAGISLYRPGPMDSIPKYLEGKHNPASIVYKTPLLEPILKQTYGCIVYQEHVMQIVRDLGGFSLAQSDEVRRAISKKYLDVMEEKRSQFIYGSTDDNGNIIVEGCQRKGVPVGVANELFDEMAEFGKYAFNKPHAAGYAYLAYQTAFLRRYHLVEFMCAVLNNRITNIDEIATYINSSLNSGINVLPPDINASGAVFSVQDGALRFGLSAIKGVGDSVANDIVAERQKSKFVDIVDFLTRVESKGLNRRTIEALIYSGAFDCFGKHRSQLMGVYELVQERVQKDKKQRESGQFSFFDILSPSSDMVTVNYPDFKEYNPKEKYLKEKEVLGVYVSGHPLEEYREYFKQYTFCASQLNKKQDEDAETDENNEMDYDNIEVRCGGLLTDVRRIMTKAGKAMAVGKLEDMTGSVEITFFPRVYEEYRQFIANDLIVEVNGYLKNESDNYKLLCRSIKTITAEKQADTDIVKLFIRIKDNNNVLFHRLQSILDDYSGDAAVFVVVDGQTRKMEHTVEICNALLTELSALLSEDDIKVVVKGKDSN